MIFRAEGGEPLRGWLHDLARAGCFVTTQTPRAAGEVLEVELRLPAVAQPVTSKARVVWASDKAIGDRPAGMGLELVDAPAETVASIDKVLGAATGMKRSKTIVGVAPPPAASSPSFAPEHEVQIPSTDTAEDGVAAIHDVSSINPPPEPAPKEEPPPEPPPPILPIAPVALPERKSPTRALAIGAAAVVVLAGIGCIVAAVRGCGGGSDAGIALDAPVDAPPETGPEAEADEPATPDVTAPPPARLEPAVTHDAGLDASHDAAHDASHKDAGKKDAGKDAGKHKKRKRH